MAVNSLCGKLIYDNLLINPGGVLIENPLNYRGFILIYKQLFIFQLVANRRNASRIIAL